MLSQIHLNPSLPNPFLCLDATKEFWEESLLRRLRNHFELGGIAVIDGLEVAEMEFFLDHKFPRFESWVPPVEARDILKGETDRDHPLWPYFKDEQTIANLKQKIPLFQSSWEQSFAKLFPAYQPKFNYWSWRLNQMDLGFLHLDIPPPYQEQQVRCFFNLSRRPRILEIGPSLESLIKKFFDEARLFELAGLSTTDYLTEVKVRLFKERRVEDWIVPRHTLRLAPGALWISHSSLITHGLVFGEKTVCHEARISTDQLVNPDRGLHQVIARLQRGDFGAAYDFPILG